MQQEGELDMVEGELEGEELEYEVSGERDQVLQVVLRQNQHLQADCHAVCWCSDHVKIRRLDSMFNVFLGARSDSINIINTSSSPAMVGLNQQQGGPILVLDFQRSVTTGIYCFKESFICASPNTIVTMKKLPFASTLNTSYGVSSQSRFLTRHCAVNKSSIIFLQSGADIMNKNLCVGESLMVNMWCCVAIEDTCTVHLSQIHQLYFGGFFAREGIMIKVEGPGKVYFCASKDSSLASGISSSNGLSRGRSSSLAILLNMIVMLLTIYMVIVLTTNIFFDTDLLDELEKQLDKQIQAARERANEDEL